MFSSWCLRNTKNCAHFSSNAFSLQFCIKFLPRNYYFSWLQGRHVYAIKPCNHLDELSGSLRQPQDEPGAQYPAGGVSPVFSGKLPVQRLHDLPADRQP